VGKLPIIVEGPDGAGKTTLAQRIATEYEREYRRPPPALLSSTHGPADHLAEWWNGQLAMRPSSLGKGVYDRCFYISDPIYQQAQVERDLHIHPKELAQGIGRLWSIEPILIFCLPDFEVTLTNIRQDDRPQLKDVSAQALSKVWNMYWATYAWCAQALYDNVMLYDYTWEDSWENLSVRLESLT
jgi:hypothetical protein